MKLYDISLYRGVCKGNMMSLRGRGYGNLDKGREGVKNPGNFADVICTWPLILSCNFSFC